MSHEVFMPPRSNVARTASSSSGTSSYHVRYTHLYRGTAHKSKSLGVSEERGRQQTAVTWSNCTHAFLRFKVIQKQLSLWKHPWLQVFHMAGTWGNPHIKIGLYYAERWSTFDIQNQAGSDTEHYKHIHMQSHCFDELPLPPDTISCNLCCWQMHWLGPAIHEWILLQN